MPEWSYNQTAIGAVACVTIGVITGVALTSFYEPLRAARESVYTIFKTAESKSAQYRVRANSLKLAEHLAAERTGRIRAEKALRDAVNNGMAGGGIGYPLLPIGRIASPFRGRWGTPRQGLLAPAARAHVLLSPAIPADALRGLDAYSHVWVLFLFNENSSMHKLGAEMESTTTTGGETADSALARTLRQRHFNALIEAPALRGAKTGVLSTRSPHRPNAVGLSLCRLVAIHPRAPGSTSPNSPMLVLEGCDLIEGTLVVDIKPFAPYDCPTCIGGWLLDGKGKKINGGCACNSNNNNNSSSSSSSSSGSGGIEGDNVVAELFTPALNVKSAFSALSIGADLAASRNAFSLRGPDWVYGSLREQATSRLPVVWAGDTAARVATAVREGKTQYYGLTAASLCGSSAKKGGAVKDNNAVIIEKEIAAALAALTQVLALDIRAVHHGRGGAPSSTRGGAALRRRMGASDNEPEPEQRPGVQYYELLFDNFDLRFTITDQEQTASAVLPVEGEGQQQRWYVTVEHVGLSLEK
jgi:tRNA (adenine37-N6)-methyltransferase